MDATVYRQDGSEAGRTVTLDPSVFDITPNDHVIWLDIKASQANARQGTHKAKERGEVAGSTRKLYRQKGTGGARAGSAKSPLRRSGGTIFGPRPRTYHQDVNRKTKRLARRSALTYKARENAIWVLDSLALDAPSTKTLVGVLQTLGLGDRKVLLVTDTVQDVLYKSGRNLPKVQVRDAASISTLEIVNAQVVVFLEGALQVISTVLDETTKETATAA
jgi:large subunit ribosomal protein L4